MSRNRYNHFGKRVDLEPAVRHIERHVLEVAVRVCEMVSVQPHRVGAHIRSRRFRGAAEREVSRRVIYTLGGRDRHFIALNRLFASVIRYGVIMSRDRHNHFVRDRRDLQRSVDRLRNDILFCSVYRVNRTIRKLCRIFADIRSLRANFDLAEISVFRRTGKAGNFLLLSIIRHRVAVRRQRDVLIIVEIDLVRSRPNRDRLLVIRYWRVAIDRNGGFRHSLAERRSIIFRICNFSRCSVQIIVYRVSGSVLFIVERQRIRLFFKRDCLRLGMTIHRQEGIGIFIILPGSQGCNVLIRFLPHIARLVIRTDHFFSIIIDILYRINGRNLSNINLSVHVPC